MELHEAIDAVMEGGQALGVTCDDVYRKMLKNEGLMLDILKDIHSGEELVFDGVHAVLIEYVKDMLIEAEKAKQEVSAGC